MVIETILGAMTGLGVGYLGQRFFLQYQKNRAINKARERIEEQDLNFMMDGKGYDLKGKIKLGSKIIKEKEIPIPKPQKDKKDKKDKKSKSSRKR